MLSAALSERALDCLSRFLSHVQGDHIALTGSAAIRIHVGEQRERMGDLDFVATSLAAVRPRVTNDFLVSHYHVPHDGYPKFMVQCVDAVTRIRLDVFPDSLGAIARATTHQIGECRILVLGAADVLRHKRETLGKSSPERPVDPKHLRHARLLADLLGERVEPVPECHFVKDVYRRDFATFVCDRCDHSSNVSFPLADKARILEILGYV